MKLSPWEPDLRTIVQRIDSSDIDLQPNFQRQEIWALAKKKRLIDTILREWSIPPVFLVVRPDARLDVLDGQQRLAAIRDFVHNDFTIDGNITPPDEKIQSLDGFTYKRLDPADRRIFDQYTLRCFRITDYSPEEPSELFYRLNQPSILTAGEQRNAFYGPAREQLKELVLRFEQGGNDRKTIGFSNVRLAYDDIIARLLFFVESRTFGIKSTESSVSQRFRMRDEFDQYVIKRAEISIDRFTNARNDLFSARFNKASVLSWLLFYCRFKHADADSQFMAQFLGAEDQFPPRTYIKDAVSLFQNRASLRVTDVSSVVYRDFCLWYSYYFSGHKLIPDEISSSTLEAVRDCLSERDDVTLEYVLSAQLDVDAWSRLR